MMRECSAAILAARVFVGAGLQAAPEAGALTHRASTRRVSNYELRVSLFEFRISSFEFRFSCKMSGLIHSRRNDA
jgi:hypothetical protein